MALDRTNYRAFAAQRNEILRKYWRMALEKSLDEIIQLARSEETTTGTYGDQTGNLRAGTGTDATVEAPKDGQKLTFAPPDLDALVQELDGTMVAFFGIAMAYAKYVAEKGPWIDRVLEAAPGIIQKNWNAANDAAMREIEAAA